MHRMVLRLRPFRTLVDLILPGGCVACSRFLPAGDGPWCVDCAMRIASAAAVDYCPRCGVTVEMPASRADGCPRCRNRRIAFEAVARIGDYDGFLRDIVHTYKFARRQTLDRPLGSLLAAAIQRQPWASDFDALVPVPTSWRSTWRYTFAPPTMLARQIGREIGVPALPILTERGKRHRQARLAVNQRADNVRGAYRVLRAARPAGSRLCIIDDVSTTGATLEEVAKVLRRAGATAIYAAVIAKTHPERI